MARTLMPKAGLMMPYIVAHRDAAVAGVETVDGLGGTVNLENKYLQISTAQRTYYTKDEVYDKETINLVVDAVVQNYLNRHDPLMDNSVALRAEQGPGLGTEPVDLIKLADDNQIIVGDLESNVQGVKIYSTGRVAVVDKNPDGSGNERENPLYSTRYKPVPSDIGAATVADISTDATTGQTTVRYTGVNSDIKELRGLTTALSTQQGGTGAKAATGPDALTAMQAGKPLHLEAEAINDNDAVTYRQAKLLGGTGGGSNANMTGVMNNFIGAVEWFVGSRTKLPAGYVAADGQFLIRSQFPDLWSAVDSGFLTSVSENDWLTNNTTTLPQKTYQRASYTKGDGTTNFRVPDLNGWQPDSLQGLFLRGCGKTGLTGMAPGTAGTVRASAIPNITGGFGKTVSATGGSIWEGGGNVSGAFTFAGASQKQYRDLSKVALAGNSTYYPSYSFTAASGDSTGSHGRDGTKEVTPNAAIGLWIIRASGAFQSAQTNFQSIVSDATLPAEASTPSGGMITSTYRANNKELGQASFRVVKTIEGTTKPTASLSVARISVTDTNNAGTNKNAVFEFDSTGGFTAQNNIKANGAVYSGTTIEAGTSLVARNGTVTATNATLRSSSTWPGVELINNSSAVANTYQGKRIVLENSASGTGTVQGNLAVYWANGTDNNGRYAVHFPRPGIASTMYVGYNGGLSTNGSSDALNTSVDMNNGVNQGWKSVGGAWKNTPNGATASVYGHLFTHCCQGLNVGNNHSTGALNQWWIQRFYDTSGNSFCRVQTNAEAWRPWNKYTVAAASDETIKDISSSLDLDVALDNIKQMEFVNFTFKGKPLNKKRGVIAQQIQKIDPQYVQKVGDLLHLDQTPMLLDALAAIKALTLKVEALEAKLADK